MAMSRIRHLVWPTQSDARNSCADENTRAAKPNSFSKSGSDSRTDSSSSTTDTSERVTFMIDVNIKGLLYGVAAALPHMQKQKSGHIINMASVFGIKMFAPGGTVYCATKAAVRALTEGLRMELHSQNIRCTMISPGAIATELSE